MEIHVQHVHRKWQIALRVRVMEVPVRNVTVDFTQVEHLVWHAAPFPNVNHVLKHQRHVLPVTRDIM